jgi:hypothetical protein
VIAYLTGASRVVRESSQDEIADLSSEIMAGSLMRAPEKTGALVDSHEIVPKSDGNGQVVAVGPAINPDTGEEYALLMHEGIGGERYKLGPISRAKSQGAPHFGRGVGIKFLTRSFRAVSRNAIKRIADGVKRDLKNVKKVRAAAVKASGERAQKQRTRAQRAKRRARRLAARFTR